MRSSPWLNADLAACKARWRCLSAAFFPLVLLSLLLLPPPRLASASDRLRQACSTCRGISERFTKGLTDTAKKNFGGGNTAWEEKTLSKYETRKKKYPDLFKWLCIETIEVCCPSGMYGPDCLACRGGSERPCHGNGRCDGDGTRGGDGSCNCNKEYKGEFCLDCSDGYYNSHKNDTHSVCTACHNSCKTCTGATNADCTDCKEGWIRNEEACVDVNECVAENSPCKTDQYCLNTDGSFSCKVCDLSCLECTGEGPTKCKSCITGYTMEDEKCTDVDECTLPDKVCVRENEDCINTPGGYKCVCSDGFQDMEGVCVLAVKTETTLADVSSPDAHEDL
ncbi:protein disulfide isomerase CRELD2 isoform X2 [Hemicordylus capensis]|uniref:protein disulfide isomerase CRELD2 isoform X2 n=1 Tax=Hemicordylus capensis TaxID=884348 RepID=UPI002302214A|nr:protein disulfide isomerase CRELD2 isoform X2 [Hemicordylus capensis]